MGLSLPSTLHPHLTFRSRSLTVLFLTERLLLKDPELALKSFFGPCVPFQYRLEGPNSWSGAREATLTAMDRLRYPLQRGRALPANSKKNLIKAAEWVMFPPMSLVLFLEVAVVVLLLVALLG